MILATSSSCYWLMSVIKKSVLVQEAINLLLCFACDGLWPCSCTLLVVASGLARSGLWPCPQWPLALPAVAFGIGPCLGKKVMSALASGLDVLKLLPRPVEEEEEEHQAAAPAGGGQRGRARPESNPHAVLKLLKTPRGRPGWKAGLSRAMRHINIAKAQQRDRNFHRKRLQCQMTFFKKRGYAKTQDYEMSADAPKGKR